MVSADSELIEAVVEQKGQQRLEQRKKEGDRKTTPATVLCGDYFLLNECSSVITELPLVKPCLLLPWHVITYLKKTLVPKRITRLLINHVT